MQDDGGVHHPPGPLPSRKGGISKKSWGTPPDPCQRGCTPLDSPLVGAALQLWGSDQPPGPLPVLGAPPAKGVAPLWTPRLWGLTPPCRLGLGPSLWTPRLKGAGAHLHAACQRGCMPLWTPCLWGLRFNYGARTIPLAPFLGRKCWGTPPYRLPVGLPLWTPRLARAGGTAPPEDTPLDSLRFMWGTSSMPPARGGCPSGLPACTCGGTSSMPPASGVAPLWTPCLHVGEVG